MARDKAGAGAQNPAGYTVMLWFFFLLGVAASISALMLCGAKPDPGVMASKRPAAAPPVRALEPRRRSWDRRPGSLLPTGRGFSLQAWAVPARTDPSGRAARVCAATCAIDRSGERARERGQRGEICRGPKALISVPRARTYGSGGSVQQQQRAAGRNHLGGFELVVDVRHRQRIQGQRESAEQRARREIKDAACAEKRRCCLQPSSPACTPPR